MGKKLQRPVIITGGGRRIGLALAHHILAQKIPVLVSYRTRYEAIDVLAQRGAVCIAADFSSLLSLRTLKRAAMVCARFCTTPATGRRKPRQRRLATRCALCCKFTFMRLIC
jgi:NAD(P)-dependent dehydrogenase (short-subunit alcohol dehydrogenase family)